MAQIIKQLKIRTSSVIRLKKEYQSYVDEIKALKNKIPTLPSATQEDISKAKKQNEFLGESESVLSNVKQKFIEAYEDLDLFVKQKSAVPDVENSPQKAKAAELLKEVQNYLEEIQ